jgi:hypothetical protein
MKHGGAREETDNYGAAASESQAWEHTAPPNRSAQTITQRAL